MSLELNVDEWSVYSLFCTLAVLVRFATQSNNRLRKLISQVHRSRVVELLSNLHSLCHTILTNAMTLVDCNVMQQCFNY